MIDDFARAAQEQTDGFALGGLPSQPATKTLILTCMDCRIDPAALFGLAPGDAHVLRNAGGVLTDDVRRSITISQRALGTHAVMVVWHTGCGMLSLTDAFRDELAAETGERPSWNVHPIADLERDLRQAVLDLRADPFIPYVDQVRGFRYDIATGALTEVHADPASAAA